MKFWAMLLAPALLYGEAGILIPSNLESPDPKIIGLEEMEIRVRIDGGNAHISTQQIFINRSGAVLEGTYTFALPARALISAFAVWDDVTRIPGVILERRRAEEIYNIAKAQAIDPGLLQAGERDEEQAKPSAVFTAKIVPIPAYGTKRVELEYGERIPVDQLQSFFAIPLRPDAFRAQTVGRLSITFELDSALPLNSFDIVGKTYPLTIQERTGNRVRASWEGRNVVLAEDFAVKYGFDPARRDSLEVIAHRADPAEPGFFEATALIGPSPAATNGPPRTVVAVFDNSLSMQWEKLERSYMALEKILRSLRPTDQFRLVLFNTQVDAYGAGPQPAEPANVDKALEYVRASRLRGGTNLTAALDAALNGIRGDSYVVLLTDGGATSGPELRNVKIADQYAARLKALTAKPRTYIFAVGDDANLPLLRLLARDNGVLEWVRSTEPIDFKLTNFIAKIGRSPISGLSLATDPASNFDMVYPLDASVFPGATAAWTGQYKQPGQASFTVTGTRDGAAVRMQKNVNLPGQSADHPQLPRTWAKARVDALLEKIEREGEDRATIDEIIRLSRKYTFVTPYTSFLAAPRALLRPRLIRPGDPVLRVRTDPAITSIVALFPFGLVKPLKYLPGEDIWQTRFLAPVDMPDGTHDVRLVLRDKQGRVFRESKSFVIASKPPTVRIRLAKTSYRRGEPLHLKVSASETSRTIMARLTGTNAVALRWNEREGANTGEMIVPAHLAPGRYPVRVTAEDFAHNIGTAEVQIEVLP